MASTNSLAARLIASPRLRWLWDAGLLLDLFVASNLAVLAADIVLAHSVNQFRKPAEYIPLIFSAVAPLPLLAGLLLRQRAHAEWAWRWIGFALGWIAVVVGLAGVLYHLESRFFLDRTLRSLTYAAPFAAPLAYAGLGFLLILNRMIPARRAEWGRWVLFLAMGGFFGNFVFCLTDHAGNGFFLKTEWIPVVSSAVAVGFLVIPLLQPTTRRYLDLCLVVLLAQALVGVLGFLFHVRMILETPGSTLFERVVYGAPPMAPLLFPNLVGLAFLGLWPVAVEAPRGQEGKWKLLDRVFDWVDSAFSS